jgi:hypothetical protein
LEVSNEYDSGARRVFERAIRANEHPAGDAVRGKKQSTKKWKRTNC